MPFIVDCLSIYSAILGLQGYHWFLPLALLGTRTNAALVTLVVGSFLILHYFPFLRFSLQKSLVDFPVLGGLEGWPLIFPFPGLLDSTFSDPPFNCFPFCHFSQVSWFLSVRLKDPQPPSFMVLLPGFPEVPDPYSWVVGSQAFWSLFLHHWVADKDISILVPCVSWHAPLNCLNPNLVLLHVSRIPGSWESLGILAQFFS